MYIDGTTEPTPVTTAISHFVVPQISASSGLPSSGETGTPTRLETETAFFCGTLMDYPHL
jgi:hypothetical protein